MWMLAPVQEGMEVQLWMWTRGQAQVKAQEQVQVQKAFKKLYYLASCHHCQNSFDDNASCHYQTCGHHTSCHMFSYHCCPCHPFYDSVCGHYWYGSLCPCLCHRLSPVANKEIWEQVSAEEKGKLNYHLHHQFHCKVQPSTRYSPTQHSSQQFYQKPSQSAGHRSACSQSTDPALLQSRHPLVLRYECTSYSPWSRCKQQRGKRAFDYCPASGHSYQVARQDWNEQQYPIQSRVPSLTRHCLQQADRHIQLMILN